MQANSCETISCLLCYLSSFADDGAFDFLNQLRYDCNIVRNFK